VLVHNCPYDPSITGGRELDEVAGLAFRHSGEGRDENGVPRPLEHEITKALLLGRLSLNKNSGNPEYRYGNTVVVVNEVTPELSTAWYKDPTKVNR
jgi:hypothetical protein